MIERLLLISCRSPFLDNDKIYPPLGLMYLHQAIKQTLPVNVTITDKYDFTDPKWLDDYDAIGVSIMTPQRFESDKILKFIKTHKPEIITIAGGPHVKHYLEDMLETERDF